MWSEREIAVAKMLQEPDTQAFLRKIFTEIKTLDGLEVLEMNIVALSDEEYGKLMKIHYLAKEENKKKLGLIRQIAQKGDTEKKPIAKAPR